MHLDSQYKAIAKAAVKPNDGSRPVLNALHVTRLTETTGELAAADGIILAVVPCTLEPGDVPGLISQEALTAAFKASPKLGAYLTLEQHTCQVRAGASFPRPEGQFPDYGRIVPRYGMATTALPHLDPEKLLRLKQALGLGPVHGLLQAQGPTKPILVHTETPETDGRPKGAYGVIMPIMAPNGPFTVTDAPADIDHSQCVSDHSRCAQASELTAARDQIERQQQSIDTLRTDLQAAQKATERARRDAEEGMMACNSDNETLQALANTRTDQRDNYARLLEQAESKLSATRDEAHAALVQLHAAEATLAAASVATDHSACIAAANDRSQAHSAQLETERSAAQARVPMAGAAEVPMGPLHARLARQFYCACGSHYDEACQCPEDTLPAAVDHEALCYAHLAGAMVAPATPAAAPSLAARFWDSYATARVTLREHIAQAIAGRLPVMAGGSEPTEPTSAPVPTFSETTADDIAAWRRAISAPVPAPTHEHSCPHCGTCTNLPGLDCYPTTPNASIPCPGCPRVYYLDCIPYTY